MPALTFLRFWREGLIAVVLLFAGVQTFRLNMSVASHNTTKAELRAERESARAFAESDGPVGWAYQATKGGGEAAESSARIAEAAAGLDPAKPPPPGGR